MRGRSYREFVCRFRFNVFKFTAMIIETPTENSSQWFPVSGRDIESVHSI